MTRRVIVVALATGATAQLVIDASGFMALRANYVQSARLDHFGMTLFPLGFDCLLLFWRRVFESRNFRLPITAEHYICPATRHIGRHCYRSRPAGFPNDRFFLRVKAAIENAMHEPRLLEPRSTWAMAVAPASSRLRAA